MIQRYAPTEQAITEEKDAFYETVENKLRNVKRPEITMVVGDLNAKVGADNKNFEHTMGRHGLGTMNENGERFAELCSNNNLVIGGTLFPNKRIHKVTWESPDQTMQNQIDHITVHKNGEDHYSMYVPSEVTMWPATTSSLMGASCLK